MPASVASLKGSSAKTIGWSSMGYFLKLSLGRIRRRESVEDADDTTAQVHVGPPVVRNIRAEGAHEEVERTVASEICDERRIACDRHWCGGFRRGR